MTDTAHAHVQAMRQEKQPPRDTVDEVAPGVLRLQLTIAFPGLGHVNCYAIEDDRGITLVDPGLPGIGPWKELNTRLEQAGLPMRRVHTVIVTHSHPDHFGASDRIRQVTGAEVVTHENFKTWWDPDEEDDEHKELADRGSLDAWAMAKEKLDAAKHKLLPNTRAWGRPTPWGSNGPRPDRKTRWRYMSQGMVLRRFFQPPKPSNRVIDGQVMRLGRTEWLAVFTPGHTTDHLCLLEPNNGIFVSGDHVLPTITPHISGLIRHEDPLKLYFASLEKMFTLDDVSVVLPAHGDTFADLHGRAKAIQEHHAERLGLLRSAAADLGEATVEAFSQRLFKPAAWGPMADSETYAHLEHLRHLGQARRRDGEGTLLYELL